MTDLNKVFYYDSESPSGIRWLVEARSGRNGCILKNSIGSIAGTNNHVKGYYSVKFNHVSYKTHRIVWALFNGNIPKDGIIDHIDGNKSNNKIENLRLVDNKTNCRNGHMSKCNTSGKTGVGFYVCGGFLVVMATWRDLCGQARKRVFSVLKYGLMPAWSMGCQARDTAILEMNKLGAGYTARHGDVKKPSNL